MPNYQNGKIYKIVNTEGTLTYIGSTCQTLARRKAKHYDSYKCWKNGKYHFTTSFKIFDDDEFGCSIILLEAYPCNSKIELEKRERHYIETIECINKYRPTRTNKEYYIDNMDKIKQQNKQYKIDNMDKIKQQKKQYAVDNMDKIKQQKKQYAVDNKDKIKQFQKQYRENNKDKLLQQQKKYYEENVDEILEYKKQYYDDNKEKILEYKNEKHKCVCGGNYTTTSKARHIKTIKHINFIESIKAQEEELEKLEKEFNEI